MEIQITYDRSKDIENILKASVAKNSTKQTSIQKLYTEQFGEEFINTNIEAFLDRYFSDRKINIQDEVDKIKVSWNQVEDEAIGRLTKMFDLDIDKKLTAYATTDSRCTYNTENGYFFVSLTSISNTPNLIILHELLHFYTWEKYYRSLKSSGVSDEDYNEIKESLTVLLNIEFSDLLDGSIDRGYPQHKQLREWIEKEYREDSNLNKLIGKMSVRKKVPQIIKDVGFDFSWSSPKVWALNEPVTDMPIEELLWHFDIPFWDSEGTDEYNLSPKQLLADPSKEPTHWSKIQKADISFPIDIMENKGRWLILDGLHRLVKLHLAGEKTIKVRIIPRSRIPEIEVNRGDSPF